MRLDTARPSDGFRPAQCSFGRRIPSGTMFVRARIPSRTMFVRARLRPPFAARKAGSKPKNGVTRCFLNPRDARAAPAAIPQGSPSREAGSILNITYSPFPRKPLIREDITPKVNLRPVTKSRLPEGGGSLAFPSGFEPLTFRLGVDPNRHREVKHSTRKSLEIQGFSPFSILSGTTLHKLIQKDFSTSNLLEISKPFDFWRTLRIQDCSTMYLLFIRSNRKSNSLSHGCVSDSQAPN